MAVSQSPALPGPAGGLPRPAAHHPPAAPFLLPPLSCRFYCVHTPQPGKQRAESRSACCVSFHHPSLGREAAGTRKRPPGRPAGAQLSRGGTEEFRAQRWKACKAMAAFKLYAQLPETPSAKPRPVGVKRENFQQRKQTKPLLRSRVIIGRRKGPAQHCSGFIEIKFPHRNAHPLKMHSDSVYSEPCNHHNNQV